VIPLALRYFRALVFFNRFDPAEYTLT